jgi:peptide/nickel transport system substrate-binding protein
VREGQGSGPFRLGERQVPGAALRLERRVMVPDGEEDRVEELRLTAAGAANAVRSFVSGETELVLGGTFADLPFVRGASLPRGALRFDPVAGLFGLAPARRGGPVADPELRRLLAQSIDRETLIRVLDVPGLSGRATLLEAGLDGVPDPVPPPWFSVPTGERRPGLIAAADRLFGADERPVLRIALPEGPGAQILFDRLSADWALLGITLERAAKGQPTDLRLIDAVAPSTSPAWFLRLFRCEAAPICIEEADPLLDGARAAPVGAQRAALLAEAARLMDEEQLFIPIAAPIRWALVSGRIEGFAENRFGRHTLTSLEERLNREGAQ